MMSREILLLLKGAIVGFFYAFLLIQYIPIHRTRGFFSTMLAEIAWIIFSILLLTLLFIYAHITPQILALIGSIILFIMAIRIYKKGEPFFPQQKEPIWKHSFRTLGYFSIFATLAVFKQPPTIWDGFLLTVGALFGTSLWGGLFFLIIYKKEDILPSKTLHRLHRLSGGILIAFSITGFLQGYL
jgi:hypothetical protein